MSSMTVRLRDQLIRLLKGVVTISDELVAEIDREGAYSDERAYESLPPKELMGSVLSRTNAVLSRLDDCDLRK